MFIFPIKDNPKGLARVSVESVFLALDFIAIALRLWASRLKRKSLAINDYAIFIALVSRNLLNYSRH